MSSSSYSPSADPPSEREERAPTGLSRSRPTSRGSTQSPLSPRKRRHSRLANSPPQARPQYNDSYRLLLNETIQCVTDPAEPTNLSKSQIGSSKWSVQEKEKFFSALSRLGKDDALGIARAVQSKTISEVSDYLLTLQDAASMYEKVNQKSFNPRDIPAAVEISSKCCNELRKAGDSLAWYQEQYEAEQEEKRHGKFWLITPEMAEGIEEDMKMKQLSSSPAIGQIESDDKIEPESSFDNVAEATVLQKVSEADLLVPHVMLELSSSLFMNSSAGLSPYPHWSDIASDNYHSPAMYLTALADFRNITISLTQRLVQASIFQATSRLRTDTWRLNRHIAQPFIKRHDVLAAISILGLERNRVEKFRGVARRCGVRVLDSNKKELSWDEAERRLGHSGRWAKVWETNGETCGETDGEELDEGKEFRSRAPRGATPLPVNTASLSDASTERDSDDEYEEVSDIGSSQLEWTQSSGPDSPGHESRIRSFRQLSDLEMTKLLESHDQEMSHAEESHLWSILGVDQPAVKQESPESEDLSTILNTKPPREELNLAENWRNWTNYRSEWEEFVTPAPKDNFTRNRKTMRVSTRDQFPGKIFVDQSAAASDTESDNESDRSDSRPRKKSKTLKTEIPVRGARAYAKIQGNLSQTDRLDTRNYAVDETDTEEPMQSIETEDYLAGEEDPMNEDGQSVMKFKNEYSE